MQPRSCRSDVLLPTVSSGCQDEFAILVFLDQGVQVGLLIDPDTHTVKVYRSSGLSKDAESGEAIPQGTTLHNGDTLIIPDLFPGWEIPITSLWPPVYE